MFRGVALALLAIFSLVAGVNAATAASFTETQKRDIEKTVHEYLVAHPEVLVEAMAALESKQAAEEERQQNEAIAANRKAIYEDPSSFVAGNPDGDVTIVEFFDYHCGYCKRAFGPLMDAIKNDGKIRLILKEFPILGPDSVIASHAALAAGKQGKYFEMHQALYRNKGELDDQRVMEIAKNIGLDTAKLKRDMADPEIARTIERNEKLASTFGVKGTPGFIIGGKSHPGALDAEELAAAVKDARESCGASC